jgi:NADPH2:quinone reductase
VSDVQAPPVTSGILRQLGALIEVGAVRAEVGAVFPLTDAARAHARSETGHGRGRIVLRVAG